MTLQDDLRHAVGIHQSGQLDEAERLYRNILAAVPDQPDATHLLGMIAAQRGQQPEAHQLLSRAQRLAPTSPAAYVHHGHVLKSLRRFEAAVVHYDIALAVAPDLVDAWNDRGVALRELRRGEDALASFERATALQPDFAVAHYNVGLVLQDLGRHDAAVASYDRALVHRPDFPEALNNRGRALIELRRYDEAVASWDQALAQRPDFAEALGNRAAALRDRLAPPPPALSAAAVALVNDALAAHDDARFEQALAMYDRALVQYPDLPELLSNRGAVLNDLKRYDEALASYARAIAIKPDFADAWSNRAATLNALARYPEALADSERALSLAPQFADAWSNRGVILAGLSRYEEALTSYDRALQLQPQFAEALQNRGGALSYCHRYDEAARDLQAALALQPDLPYAAGELLHSRMHIADWQGFDQAKSALVAGVEAGKRCVTPFAFMSIADSAQAHQQCARLWCIDKCPAAPDPTWRGPAFQHDRIRVAYLSADFRDHAMPALLAGVFEQHDRTRFETIAVSFGPATSGTMRARLEAAFERFVDVQHRGDDDVAALLRQWEVDIAVDLTGYTLNARSRILARRPAPIQVNYLGFPGTMAHPAIDYILADRFVIPAAREGDYTERVVLLPDCFQGNDTKRAIAPITPTRASAGLPAQGWVFCCFNNSYKITPLIFDAWMRVLLQVPHSVLWLLGGHPKLEANLRREAALRGVDAARLVFAPRLDYPEHLARYRLADLFLDTLPFNAGTTASDALWAGLPVLTCAGDAFAGRMAGSLLTALGLESLITSSLDAYEARAVQLALARDELYGMRRQMALHRDSSALFDTGRFRRHLEAAYVAMWERHQSGLPPAAMTIPPLQ